MRVLVVDDSILMRNIIKEMFRDSGVAVLGEGGDGRAAVELNRALRPDLIVMDINMPIMNGLEATMAIMTNAPPPSSFFRTRSMPRFPSGPSRPGPWRSWPSPISTSSTTRSIPTDF